jgi:hypothetical protein
MFRNFVIHSFLRREKNMNYYFLNTEFIEYLGGNLILVPNDLT